MLSPDPDFWRGRRVFLTGHTGFKGGWLSLWLQAMGVDLYGLALAPSTTPSLFELARVHEGMTSSLGDVRDLQTVLCAMKSAAPEIVIHMAAQPLVRQSYKDPVETYATNVMGTVHLLEAVRHCPTVRVVVNVTTDKCYQNHEWPWPYRESDSLGGHDPYSSSKACSELVTAAFRHSFFDTTDHETEPVCLATVRAGNVIGGGDWSTDRLIPDVLNGFSRKKPVEIRNPLATRPWQHVLEPLRGYLLLAERMHAEGCKFAQAFNFGPRPEDVKPVGWIVNTLADLWGDGAVWQVDRSDHPHEARSLKLDVSKASQSLGWEPALSIHDALQLTVDWVRGVERGLSPKNLTLSQIKNYLSYSSS